MSVVTRTRIKICGMTDPAEVAGAAAAGVDALGFIFAEKSPRRIKPDQARELIASLPPFVDAVGVFMDQELHEVNRIVRHCGLSLAQLHGDESPEYCAAVDCRVIKVFRLKDPPTETIFLPYRDRVTAFLFDTFSRQAAGGTGLAFDWRLLEGLDLPRPIILAGGLTPENVAAAIATVRPYAVDFNSGVESAPGRKNLDLVRAAVAAVGRQNRSAAD